MKSKNLLLLILILTFLILPLSSVFPEENVPEIIDPSVLTDKSPHEIMAENGPAVVMFSGLHSQTGEALNLGSGFIVSPEGIIVTSAQVIKDQYPVFIKLVDGQIFWDILVIHYDQAHDFAILKVNGLRLPFIELGEKPEETAEEVEPGELTEGIKVQAGEVITALGNPQGFEPMFSESKITGLTVPRKEMGTTYQLETDVKTYEQTASGGFVAGGQTELPDGKVSEGFLSTDQFNEEYDVEKAVYELERALLSEVRGGPVFNVKGEVIGVAMERFVDKQSQSFVIPINLVQTYAQDDPVMTLEELNAKDEAQKSLKEQTALNAHRKEEIDFVKGFYVYQDADSPENRFVPLGRKGDYSAISLNERHAANCQNGESCIKIRYTPDPETSSGWGAGYWQKPHWAGWEGYDLTGAHRLMFWARGEKGGERIEKFKVGGGREALKDSDVSIIGPIILNKEWGQYSINLDYKDLSLINTGFYWEVSFEQNPEGVTFYLDDIKFQ